MARRLFDEPPRRDGSDDIWRYGSDEALELHIGGPRCGTWYDHKAGGGGDTLAGAWFLWHARFMRRRVGTLLVTLLLATSGLFTAVSGLCAMALAQVAPEPTTAEAAELVAELRWISGKIGFTLAGLALLATAVRQWRVGGSLRRLAPFSAFVGLAMQLIWVPAATLLHRFTGPLFVVWLALIGFLLASG